MRAETVMSHLSPQTLTHAEQRAILRATRRNLRDHLIYSLALGTGLRLAEIVGLDVGDVYMPEGKPKNRVRLRPEIAKNGRVHLLWVEYIKVHPDGYRYSQFCKHYRRFACTLSPTMRQVHRAGEKLFVDFSGKRPEIVDLRTEIF